MCYNCCCDDSVKVCNTVDVKGCVLTDKQLVDFKPLSKSSEILEVTASNDINIKDHPCADHCYNFEEDLIDPGSDLEIEDDCGDVRARTTR